MRIANRNIPNIIKINVYMNFQNGKITKSLNICKVPVDIEVLF